MPDLARKVSGGGRNEDAALYIKAAVVAAASVVLSASFIVLTNVDFHPVLLAGLSALTFLAVPEAARFYRGLDRRGRILCAVFAAVFAVTTLIGGRVVRPEWFYDGTWQENYMGQFTAADFFWTPCFFAWSLVLIGAVSGLYDRAANWARRSWQVRFRKEGYAIAHTKALFFVAWAVIMVCWIPYFLANWPGAMYEDSMQSIYQALGLSDLTNHHPVLYTLMIGVFLRAGQALFGSYAMGVAMYTLAQMLFVSATFAYLLVWLDRKGASIGIIAVIGAVFALLSIYPLHAISMWKDALFAAFLLLYALLVFDVVQSRGELLHKPSAVVRLAVLTLAVCFSRNNGIFAMLLTTVVLVCIYAVVRRSRIERPWFAGVLGAALVAYGIVVGPVYAACGISSEPVESYAVPLQQVTAVVVYDGDMTDEQREFLDTLLPLEDYKEDYIPCSVDAIKWDYDFDTEFFNSHQLEFLKVWAELMVANPDIYLNAYTMETYEYWSIGDFMLNFNINGMNTKAHNDDLGLQDVNLLEEWFGSGVADLFPFTFVFPSEGTVSWLVLYMGLWLSLHRGWRRYALTLLPAVGSWATLLLSAPFAGLHRYVLPSEFLLPLVLVLPVVVAFVEQHRAQTVGGPVRSDAGSE